MPTLPYSPERTGPEARAPDPMYSNWNGRSSSSSIRKSSNKRRQRTPSKFNSFHSKSSINTSTRKRPQWLHSAIEFKRDPFTSGYCYSFKDRTTSVTTEAKAWSDAAHRIDEQRRRSIEKKRVRKRHLATFRAMQRASYDSEFDDDMTVGGGTASSIQYVPATRIGLPIASRVATTAVRKEVDNLLTQLRSRPPPPTQSSFTTSTLDVTSTPSSNNTGLRFSDLNKQQRQRQRQQQHVGKEQEATPSPENDTLNELQKAREKLDAMDEKNIHRVSFNVDTPSSSTSTSSPSTKTSLNDGLDDMMMSTTATTATSNEMELDTMMPTSTTTTTTATTATTATSNAMELALELKRTKASLEAARQRIETEVNLRIQIETAQKKSTTTTTTTATANETEDGDEVIETMPLKEVIKERETRKARFDSMLTQLEVKHHEEKSRAQESEKTLQSQIAELMKRLDQSDQQVAALTQAQREKDRTFDGRETA